MKKVILISGKKRTGKDELGRILEDILSKQGLGVVVDAYAKDLKRWAAEDFSDFANILNTKIDLIMASIVGLFSNHLPYPERGVTLLDHVKTELNQLKIKNYNWDDRKTDLTRSLIQTYGTEIVRNRIEDEYWINRLVHRVNCIDTDVYIITDARFINELDAEFKDAEVYTVRVERGVRSNDSHSSETSLDTYGGFNYIVDNNGTLADLTEAANNIINDIFDERRSE